MKLTLRRPGIILGDDAFKPGLLPQKLGAPQDAEQKKAPVFFNTTMNIPKTGILNLMRKHTKRISPTSARTVRAEYPRAKGVVNTLGAGILKHMRKHTKIISPTSARLVGAEYPRHRVVRPEQNIPVWGIFIKTCISPTRGYSSKREYPRVGGYSRASSTAP